MCDVEWVDGVEVGAGIQGEWWNYEEERNGFPLQVSGLLCHPTSQGSRGRVVSIATLIAD